MPFIIKSFHAPPGHTERRIWFWQTPWVVPYDDKPSWRQIGGWVKASADATLYDNQAEAEAVNVIRYLGGTVDAARV